MSHPQPIGRLACLVLLVICLSTRVEQPATPPLAHQQQAALEQRDALGLEAQRLHRAGTLNTERTEPETRP
jgi:hypothetical protein